MAERANLVVGLTIEKVIVYGDRCPYQVMSEPFIYHTELDGAQAFIGTTHEIEQRIAPVIEICGIGSSNLLVAYTEDVEKLLEIPISTIKKELDACRKSNSSLEDRLERLRNLGLWDRIKFLFKCKIE